MSDEEARREYERAVSAEHMNVKRPSPSPAPAAPCPRPECPLHLSAGPGDVTHDIGAPAAPAAAMTSEQEPLKIATDIIGELEQSNFGRSIRTTDYPLPYRWLRGRIAAALLAYARTERERQREEDAALLESLQHRAVLAEESRRRPLG